MDSINIDKILSEQKTIQKNVKDKVVDLLLYNIYF